MVSKKYKSANLPLEDSKATKVEHRTGRSQHKNLNL